MLPLWLGGNKIQGSWWLILEVLLKTETWDNDSAAVEEAHQQREACTLDQQHYHKPPGPPRKDSQWVASGKTTQTRKWAFMNA